LRRLTNLAGIATALLLLVGCGGPDTSHLPATVDASGVVLLDGTPLEGATVVLVPANSEHSGNGMTDAKGRFELKAFEAKDGVVPGDYMVQITKTVEIKASDSAASEVEGSAEAAEHAAAGGSDVVGYKNDLPAKYENPATSGLDVTIPDTGVTDLKFELTSE
jgi:hypothetical protein